MQNMHSVARPIRVKGFFIFFLLRKPESGKPCIGSNAIDDLQVRLRFFASNKKN